MSVALVMITLNLALGGLVLLLGLVILRENTRQRLNRVVAWMLFFGATGSVLGALSLLSSGGSAAAGARTTPDLLQNFAYAWEFFFPTLLYFASIFPEERDYIRRLTRWGGAVRLGFGALIFLPHAFHLVLMIVLSVWKPTFATPESGMFAYFGPVFGVARVLVGLFLAIHQGLFSLVNLGYGIGTMFLLFQSYRAATVPRLRQQLRAIAIGLSACLVLYASANVVALFPGLFGPAVADSLRSSLTIVALTLGSGTIAYAIVRYKFLDTRVLARRGVLYALVSGAIVVFYILVVAPVNRLITHMTGVDARVFEPVFLIMTLALFQPTVARIEDLLDRRLLKDPGDYRNVLRRLRLELQTTIDLDTLLTRTIGTLSEALLLRRGHIVVLTASGSIVRSGTGQPPTEAQGAALGRVLPKLPGQDAAFRLADRISTLDDAEQELLGREMGLALVVPLRWRGETLGALLLGGKLTDTDYTSEDVALLTDLASQVSVSLQNALLLSERVAVARIEEELNLARQIQSASLISVFPRLPRLEMFALTVPSKHVGGDFYDVVPTMDGGHLIAIADVSGKGVPAALMSSMLQASLRTQAGDRSSLSAILRNINALMYRSTSDNQFATFFLAHVSEDSLVLRFSNAGHNWPVVLRRGSARTFLERGGTLLGILENVAYEEDHVILRPGDVVVLYTDGVSEAMNDAGEMFGEDRLLELVEGLPDGIGAREITVCIQNGVHAFLGHLEPQDDMTIVVLQALEPAATVDGAAADREIAAAF
jgi:serine phosphatase RsbU (regulator of sigma subunit)